MGLWEMKMAYRIADPWHQQPLYESSNLTTPVFSTRHGLLYNADCIKLLSFMRDECVDLVFADPPFNLGKIYGSGYSDRYSKSEFMEWCALWIAECSRVLKPGGSFFLYAIPELAYKFANIMESTLEFRHWVALSMKGTFPRGKKLYPAHYALLYFSKRLPKVFNHLRLPIPKCRHCGKDVKDYGGHRKYLNPAGLNLTDFWEDTSPNRHKKTKFRANINELKPIIPERAVQISTNEGDLVFDPFGGGGSTYEVAEKNNRNWLGCEICTSEAIAERMKTRFPLSYGKNIRYSLSSVFEPSPMLTRGEK